METKTLALLIKQQALELGFDDCGIARAEKLEHEKDFLHSWLENDYHADMAYMAKNREKRIDPTKLMEGAKSVICLLSNYKPAQWQPPDVPQIAAFAYGKDYHRVLKERLSRLKQFIHNLTQPPSAFCLPPSAFRLFIDTAPILERAWAARAGLGWIGKSTLLVSPRFGPFAFISIILIDIELDYDTPMKAQCGECRNCINACPTGALCAPYTLDARRCISYQTIENKSPCAQNPTPYIFGCDHCLRACPWGSKAPDTTLFLPLPSLLQLTAKKWAEMAPDHFTQHFSDSALGRAGFLKIQNTLTLWNGKPK
jgi:epoxyqueuosine reductase